MPPSPDPEMRHVCSLLGDVRTQLAAQSVKLEAIDSKLDAHLEADNARFARQEQALLASNALHREAERFRGRVTGIGIAIGLLLTTGAAYLALVA